MPPWTPWLIMGLYFIAAVTAARRVYINLDETRQGKFKDDDPFAVILGGALWPLVVLFWLVARPTPRQRALKKAERDLHRTDNWPAKP